MKPRARIRTILTNVSVASTLNKLMDYQHREDAVGVVEQAMANTHAHTHTHSVPRDTHCRWSLGRETNAILTLVGVAWPLIELMGYELREDEVGVGGAGNGKHTRTHTHTQCPS